ncbi:hypothetical protein DUNSADRAFT_8587, partial [Dunaliella salina]
TEDLRFPFASMACLSITANSRGMALRPLTRAPACHPNRVKAAKGMQTRPAAVSNSAEPAPASAVPRHALAAAAALALLMPSPAFADMEAGKSVFNQNCGE